MSSIVMNCLRLANIEHPLVSAERAMKPHGVVQRSHHHDLRVGTVASKPASAMCEGHSVEQVMIRPVGDHALVQSQSITQTALTLDPEHLLSPHFWVAKIFECGRACVLEVQGHRLFQTQLEQVGQAIGHFGAGNHGQDQLLLALEGAVVRNVWHWVLMASSVGTRHLKAGGAYKNVVPALLGRHCSCAI